MNPKNANTLNDFLHDLGNALAIIGGQAKRLNVITVEVHRLERALEKYTQETRKCPYAKEKGAKCGHVPH